MASNYCAIAASNTRNNVAIMAANRESMPDYTAIANEAIKGRSRERIAAIQAESQVRQQGIKSTGQVKQYQIAADSKKKIADIKKPAQRFAGIVGAAGTMASAYMIKQGNDASDKRAAELETARAQRHEEIMTQLNKPGDPPPTLPPPPVYEVPTLLKPGDPIPGIPSPGKPEGGSTPPSPGASTPPSTPAQGRILSQQEGYQLLIDQGMDPANARIGAAVMMGESFGKSGALNSNGEYSLGLWQHNRDTGEDRRAFYGIKDWSELADPVTNARATYRLWERAGKKWTDWGAFTNGSYQDYL